MIKSMRSIRNAILRGDHAVSYTVHLAPAGSAHDILTVLVLHDDLFRVVAVAVKEYTCQAHYAVIS